MNYLAHAYLSFGIAEITVGNLISDFVKGKKKFDYPERIQQGIALHRAIDDFTDTHPVTRQAKLIFSEAYGLYSGAIVDVVYDHFLANDPLIFPTDATLESFAQKTYSQLSDWQPVFPDRFARMFQYMRSQNWLYGYRFKQGLNNSLEGLARRAAYMKDAGEAQHLTAGHHDELQALYAQFFPSLKEFALRTLEKLQQNPEIG